MKIRTNSSGFSVVEVTIVVAVIGILGFAGYNVYNRIQDNKTASNTSQTTENKQSSTSGDVAQAPVVQTNADLDKAGKALDQTNVDASSDDTQLDADLATF